jgi:hypothetical protein
VQESGAEVRSSANIRQHYELASDTIPDRLARLIEKIEQAELERPGNGHSPMSKRDEYLANAQECERLAAIAHTAEEKAACLQMAQQWLRWMKRQITDRHDLAARRSFTLAIVIVFGTIAGWLVARALGI